jgi:hypothetical protein
MFFYYNDLNSYVLIYKMAETLPEIPENATTECSPPPPAEEKQVSVIDIPVTDENSALNVMVAFLGVAQKRGAFAINEAAKIYECIQVFQNNLNKGKSTEN